MAVKGSPIVLVVDDERELCGLIQMLLESQGYRVVVAHDGATAMRLVKDIKPDAMLLDSVMPEPNGMAVLGYVRDQSPGLPVIMMSAYPGMNSAICAIKAGAWEYLPKPFQNENLVELVNRAVASRMAPQSAEAMGTTAAAYASLMKSMGSSSLIQELAENIVRVARTDYSVLIQGETGTGKELVARHIHMASKRAAGPFVAVDCGALQDTLVENELFGHDKGSYTGAYAAVKGKFEQAYGGTLFLDELGNLSLVAQGKLLRALQERVVYRVGGCMPVRVDIRLVAATNENLMEEIVRGRFREDLYYRLNEFNLHIPPLRSRPADIPYLVDRFLREACAELHRSLPQVDERAMAKLVEYSWPGNVRQLRTKIRRALISCGERIEESSLGQASQLLEDGLLSPVNYESGAGLGNAAAIQAMLADGLTFKEIVQRIVAKTEVEVIEVCLKSSKGNKAEVARKLKIDYKTLFNKLKRYKLEA